jgi:ABC-type Fe3+ transport system permease subunit
VSEKELGKALLELNALDLAGVPDVRKQTEKVLDRDRRRMRWLTVLTVLAWLAAVAMVLLMLVAFGFLFPKQAQLRMNLEQGQIEGVEAQRLQAVNQIAFQMITLGVTASVGILGLAALMTIVLVVASRRATLRQINANLLVISEQLKKLQRPREST